MTTDQAADVLIIVAPEIEELVNDDDLVDKFKNRLVTEDKTKAGRLGLINILSISAYLLEKHRNATWTILAALNNKTIEEIGNQLVFVTVKQITEALKDEELRSFFI